MVDQVKARQYDGSRRRAAAAQTRARVLRAARDLFAARGYDDTAVAEIARQARVSVDTVYATVGRKPQLLLAVHDMELAGSSDPLSAEARDYVKRIREASGARDKIEIYAAALAERLPHTVPLLVALRAAAVRDPECLRVHRAISERRAANMRLFAADLRATGELRDDLGDDAVATLVWSMNSPDYFQLLADEGLTPQEYAALVTEVWTRTFLR